MNTTIRDWFDWRGWTIFGAAAVAIVFGLIWILWPPFGEFIADSVTATWAAAIGTFSAAIVALSTAGIEWRRRRTEGMDKAALYAAHLAPRIETYVDTLMNAAAEIFFGHDKPEPVMPRVQSTLKRLEIHIPLEQLLYLVPLERRAAHRIARGVSLAEIVTAEICAIKQPEDFANDRCLAFAGPLMEASELLRVANETCRLAADAYAKRPSSEELYGPPDFNPDEG